MFILQPLLLISFIGLVLIVARNRLKNPEMRIQFFEDLDMNKKRLKRVQLFIIQLVKKLREKGVYGGKRIISHGKTLLPQLAKGVVFFLEDLRMFGVRVKTKVVQHTKDIREDMKAFELPKHKERFLEELDEKPFSGTHKEASLDESILIPPGVNEKQLRGFQIAHLSETHTFEELEVDRCILEKKEQWLVYAIAKNPKNPTFYKKLGKIYFQMNNFEDAKNCFEYAVKLGSQDLEVGSLLLEVKRNMPT